MTIWTQILLLTLWGQQTSSDTYFDFVPATDTTSFIKWGNKDFHRQTSKAYDNWTIKRLFKKTEDNKYIALTAGTGSDTHILIILPLDKNNKVKEYWNDLTVDLVNDIVVYEYGRQDTVLIAENIKTGGKQAIGAGWTTCTSAFPHYCIDDIKIENKTLKLSWTFSDKGHESSNRQYKIIKLTI